MKNLKNLHSLSIQLDDWFAKLTRNSRVESFNLPSNTIAPKLFVKRDDLIHPFISGNKLRKLKYNIIAAMESGCSGILTYGGAFSNHLLATAAAGKELGISVIGCVRGEELSSESNALLKRCYDMGMDLQFITRTAFLQEKYTSGKKMINDQCYWVIPEGGANREGVQGCTEIVGELETVFDYYMLAQGTTTTSVGLLLSIPENSKLIVVPVLKGFDVLGEMKKVLNDDALFDVLQSKLIIWDHAHHGGYAKTSPELIQFIDDFHQVNSFQIEPVYTGKVMYAFAENHHLLNTNSENLAVLFIHTGGILH
ncbi:MAG: 1-aminocyclopropane-1-carboxylate deaminase/D-cysteine desulfhydrase [Flavobacteriales bacterium]